MRALGIFILATFGLAILVLIYGTAISYQEVPDEEALSDMEKDELFEIEEKDATDKYVRPARNERSKRWDPGHEQHALWLHCKDGCFARYKHTNFTMLKLCLTFCNCKYVQGGKDNKPPKCDDPNPGNVTR